MSAEDRFVFVARRFVAFIDEFEAHPRGEFIRELEPLLTDLYSSALGLEHGHIDDGHIEDAADAERMDGDEWWDLFQRLGRHLGSYDAYSFVFDPYDLEAQPVEGRLSDDLADIRRDLLEGLHLYDEGHTGDAVWEWRFAFDSHWGRHAAHALYALRVLHVDHAL